MKDEKISFCFIENFPSMLEGIFDLTGISKSQLKKYQFKKAFLDKQVRAKDQIELPINLVNHLKINPNYQGPEVKILFEDENFLALSKPPQVFSHPLSYDEKDNLLSAMLSMQKYKELLVNVDSYDRGLLYRLDFETSGLMLYIKKQELYENLRENFQNVVKKKIYLAVVSGDCKFQKLNTYLAPSGKKGHIMVESPEGVLNEIKLEKLAYNEKEDLSLLKVYLGHGHRHQIRAQLACADHPLLGDDLYGGVSKERLYLHCLEYHLEINGEEKVFLDQNYSDLVFRNFPGFNHKL